MSLRHGSLWLDLTEPETDTADTPTEAVGKHSEPSRSAGFLK